MTDIELDFEAVKQDYKRDGFVVLRGYLGEAEVAALRERAIPLAAQLMESEPVHEKYRNLLKSLHRHDDWFKHELNEGRHLPLLRHLVGERVHGASAAWFDRPEGESVGVGPHVDALGRDEYPSLGTTIWFALDPVNVANGCLHYLRGSHRNRYPDVIPIPGIDVDGADACAAELEPGDAVIHSARTVHWSGGNVSGKPRRAVSYFYFSASAYAAMHPEQKVKEA